MFIRKSVICLLLLLAITACASRELADSDKAQTPGRILTTDKGMTLYMYDPNNVAICSEGCIPWPPYGYARNEAPSESAEPIKMVLAWFDELKVWSIGGQPLHTFSGDKKPGDITGNFGGWFVAREPLD